MSMANKFSLKQAIIEKLDDPTFSRLQTAPEELSNYALLNIERNCDLKAMVDNLSVFMGDAANSFCKWLFAYTGQHERQAEEELVRSQRHRRSDSNSRPAHDRTAIRSRDASYERGAVYSFADANRHVNDSWVVRDRPGDSVVVQRQQRFGRSSSLELPSTGRLHHIPSVVSYDRRRTNHPVSDQAERRGATHVFLRAVGEVEDQSKRCRLQRTSRHRRPYDLRNTTRFSGDLRDRINEARRQRQQQVEEGGTAGDGERIDLVRTMEGPTRRMTRLTHIEATVTDQQQTDDVEMLAPAPQEDPKKKIRCKFWPKCARGDACVYVHPSEACRLFPDCQFGSTCLYIHPTCPNDGSCPKTDCPYLHQKQLKPVIKLPVNQFVVNNVSPQGTPAIPICHFPKVGNPGTRRICRPVAYSLPKKKVCYFNATCTRPGCPFLHPSRTKFTCKSAFTWVKPIARSLVNKQNNFHLPTNRAAMDPELPEDNDQKMEEL